MTATATVAPTITATLEPTATSSPTPQPAPAPSGLTILAVDEAGHPLPGACFSAVLRLRGGEAPPGLALLDLSALRAGVVVVEVCDAGDGRSDGVLTVGGVVANVKREIAAVLAAPDVEPDLVALLEGLTLTIDLIQTRLPDSEGGATSNRPLPRIAMTLADLGSGGSVRVIYGASDTPVTLSPDETPAPSDGTGIID